MEPLVLEPSQGLIACCECGAPITPNPANMCVGCVRSRVDITDGIPKQGQLYSCRNCDRYFLPPNTWTHAKLESKELLSVCLKRMKPSMTKVRLVDAAFIWTEPHSKRVKVKLTIQQEVFVGAILQQSFVVEFTICNQMCDECRRAEAKDYWRACVQIRQKSTNIKPCPTGIDFYFAKLQDARKLVDFISTVLPSKFQYSQQLITHDSKNNVYDYKHTFCVDLVPITRDSLICLPKKVAQHMGNMGQFVLCLRVTNIVTLIDPSTLQMNEINATAYWKEPFEILCQPKTMTEFYVLEVDDVANTKPQPGHGYISNRHRLADVWVVRSNQVGQSDARTVCCRTHLGHLLSPGDTVLGFDVANSNLNNSVFEKVKTENVPDVVLVRKAYDRANRSRKRQWKLKRLYDQVETESMQNDFTGFMEDLEEDPLIREKINIYRKKDRARTESIATTTDGGEPIPDGPTLAEMLDDLDLNDVEMEDKTTQ
ncbi:NMD3 family domain-containing protein [Ditylenchus destructor]|nr:NMD3 family domain-containing protein [Ditylenchus destructor]